MALVRGADVTADVDDCVAGIVTTDDSLQCRQGCRCKWLCGWGCGQGHV